MKKIFKKIILLFIVLICLCSCFDDNIDSSFSITFIDVGHGDSALIECDGHYMLIDGGDKVKDNHNPVCETLQSKNVKVLDYLVLSHLHADHIGGLTKAITCLEDIQMTLSPSDYESTNVFREFEHELSRLSKISVPSLDETFQLGSASIKVVDVMDEQHNDSLVLLITYKKTKFLFTGDIEASAQTRLSNKYAEGCAVDLIKMPHHGAYVDALDRLLNIFTPKYAVISVGNKYDHPSQNTLDLLENAKWKPKVYTTHKNGDIIVKSNGKDIEILTEK